MDNLGEIKLWARAKAGSHISNCCYEAVKLAITERRIVYFIHNEKTYMADPNKFIELVYQSEKISGEIQCHS